eukprot:scpid68599/ scgid24227/ 
MHRWFRTDIQALAKAENKKIEEIQTHSAAGLAQTRRSKPDNSQYPQSSVLGGIFHSTLRTGMCARESRLLHTRDCDAGQVEADVGACRIPTLPRTCRGWSMAYTSSPEDM